MSVPQFTTPTFTLTFTEQSLNLTEAVNVYVTFQARQTSITKTGDALEIAAKTIGVHLTQEETGKLGLGDERIQANWTTPNGNRAASEVATHMISEQLLRRVVT